MSITTTIAIPCANGQLCQHFGHCQTFALCAIENDEISRISFREPPPHEPGVLPAWLADLGTTIVIAGGMGQRAQMLFAQRGIEVITGAPAVAPAQIVEDYLAGKLVTGANACDH